MKNIIIVGLHLLLSAALWWSVFCRSVRMSECSTRLDIRLAMWLLGCAALVSFAAPIVWTHWQPDTPSLLLLLGITSVQLATAHHWHDGVPSRFLYPHAQPRNRRSTDQCTRTAPPSPLAPPPAPRRSVQGVTHAHSAHANSSDARRSFSADSSSPTYPHMTTIPAGDYCGATFSASDCSSSDCGSSGGSD